MKKLSLILLLTLSLLILFTACGFEYLILNALPEEIALPKNDHLPEKEKTLFGIPLTLSYGGSFIYPDRGITVDRYYSDADYRTTYANFNRENDTLVYYETTSHDNIPEKPAITPMGNEADFLAYAQELLWQLAGVSTDGWSYRLETYHTLNGYTTGFASGDDKTDYIFTFYKTLDGIERSDRMTVRTTAYGDIILFDAMPNDTAFADFADFTLDREALTESASAYFQALKLSSRSHIVKILSLSVREGKLYATIEIENQTASGDHESYVYAAQLTE